MRSRLLTGTKEMAQAFGRWCERAESIRIVTGLGNDRLHGVRVSGESAQQDQHDGGRPGFLHDLAVFPRIVPVSHTHRQSAAGSNISPEALFARNRRPVRLRHGQLEFTRGGFGDNAKLNICIEGKKSDEFFRQVEVFIEEQEKHSDPITAPEDRR